jgi:hypothetical protein
MARGRGVDEETKRRVQKGVSDTKKAWDAARKTASQPMGPGQSMAMSGNTGLAGFSENQANEIKKAQQAIQNYNQSQGGGSNKPPVSFKDIGQQIGELGSKYRRPVGFDQYANKAMLFNQGIAGGGKIVVGPDGIPRLQFGDQVVRDPNTGAQMLSMMLPQLTASAPTLSQLGGDISRAFTGYDSLKYPDQSFQGPFLSGQNADTPYMSRTPGMFEGVNPLSLIPGVGTVMKIGEGIKSVYDFMFPKPPVVNYGGSSDITVTEEPQFPYNFETNIKPKPLTNEILPTELTEEDFNNTYQFLNDSRLKDLPFKAVPNISNVNLNNSQLAEVNPEQRQMLDQYLFNEMLQEEIERNKQQKLFDDMNPEYRIDPEGQPVLMAQNFGLPSLKQSYDFLRNPQVETPLGNLKFDNFLSGNPQLGYSNTVDIFGQPIDVTATIGSKGANIGGSFSFKDGGSVNKNSGLGYMFK